MDKRMSMNNFDSNATRFRRLPVKRTLIEDLTEGTWLEEEKTMSTRYGKLKRVRLCGTVLRRREPQEESSEESFLDDSFNQNTRLSFQIDDGTGRIWATIWGIDVGDYEFVRPGALVDVMGITRIYRNKPSLTAEFARAVKDPNLEIYHVLRVLQRRKHEPRQPIEQSTSSNFESFDSYDDIDSGSGRDGTRKSPQTIASNSTFSESDADDFEDESVEIMRTESSFKNLDAMDQIIDYIKQNDEGDGVSIQNIAESFSLEINQLKGFLDQLSQDVKIYKTSPGHYASY